MRISALANFDRWAALEPEAYRRQSSVATSEWRPQQSGSCPISARAVVETDLFTPLTIRRFTGHADGSSTVPPKSAADGTTHLKNLYICGNDQGLVGIVGTIISGISIANRHLLK